MKYILIKIIRIYQKIPGKFHQQCRHIPTCSNYAIEAISRFGCLKGCFLALKRIFKCNPWGSSGIDLVPEKKGKKKMKKVIGLFSICLLLTSGCFKKDNLEDITIYTSVYPIEYIVNTLYGKNSTVFSIYPDGVDVNQYELTNKQIKDYSKADMFIFNGLSNEKDYVSSMFNYNKDLMIIDTSSTIEYSNHIEELWIDPSNFLMMALNIKNGLTEYISNQYLKNEIESNYEKLKIEISNIDAKIKLMNENSSKKVLVVDNSSLQFLEKYGFEVISLEKNENLTEKNIYQVIDMIQSGQVKYIFTMNSKKLNSSVQNIVSKTGVSIIELNDLSNLTDKQRSTKEDYISLLNENIDALKKELYS